MKIWFAGTPYFAAEILKSLLNNDDCEITGVLSQPDRRAGRGKKITAPPVKTVALEAGIAVEQPTSLNKEDAPFSGEERPDLCIVVAYGLLLPEWFLTYPKYGCINIHASLLPRWRGAAPIQRAIEAGDQETGVGIMQMDKGLDTGAVWLEKKVKIDDTDNTETLTEKLIHISKEAISNVLPIIATEKQQPKAQSEHGITYAHKLNKKEAKINWTESAALIARKIRAFNPAPVAYTQLEEDNIRIYQVGIVDEQSQQPAGRIFKQDKTGFYVACGEQSLRIEILQLPGKKAVHASQLINSKNWVGAQFL